MHQVASLLRVLRIIDSVDEVVVVVDNREPLSMQQSDLLQVRRLKSLEVARVEVEGKLVLLDESVELGVGDGWAFRVRAALKCEGLLTRLHYY